MLEEIAKMAQTTHLWGVGSLQKGKEDGSGD